jgi:CRP/FNR family transcriptional regulator, transcriptional activator FtrB
MASKSNSQFLKSIPALANVEDSLLDRIVESGRIEDVPAGTFLFERGQLPEELFVLLRGMVALTSSTRGDSTTVDILKPVATFQLSAVLLSAPYLLNALVLQPSCVFRIGADIVRRFVETEPELAIAAAHYLSTQYRDAVGEVLHLKLRSVTERLAGYLLSLAEDGSEVRLPYGKRQLAARLGASPEHLSRAFATLRKYGVTTRGSRVTVGDRDRLAALIAPDGVSAPPLPDRAAPVAPA